MILSLAEVIQALKTIPQKPREKTLRDNSSDLYESIILYTEGLPSEIDFSHRIGLLLENKLDIPLCPICSGKCNWVKGRRWSEYCSRVCATRARYGVDNISQVGWVKEKKITETRKKYGVDNISQLKETQEKIQASSIQKYGVAHHLRAKAVIAKREATNLTKFGVEVVFASPVIQAKILQTNQERYGVEYPQQSEIIRATTIANCLKRYGVQSPLELPEVYAKSRCTYMARHGVAFPQQNPEVQLQTQATCLAKYGHAIPLLGPKTKLTMLRKYGVENPFESHALMGRDWSSDVIEKITTKDFWEKSYVTEHKTLVQIGAELGLTPTTAANYMKKYAPDIVIRLQSANSNEEHELKNYIVSLLPGLDVVTTKFRWADTFDPTLASSTKQWGLDIFIPSHHLAFEYNGLYWHSSAFDRADTYHLTKTEEAERMGFRLVHIWSDDWLFKRDIIEAKVKAILGLGSNQTVFARKCTIEIPTQAEKSEFYTRNHIKGDGAGSISYMLVSDHKIVSMITFKRTQNPKVFDLNRFAVDSSVRVPGGFSRLLAHFKRNQDWSRITTFADRCWSRGDVYLKNGFTLVGSTQPAFHGVEAGHRVSRLQYTHERLSTRFSDTYDPTKSQLVNMELAGIPRIYDCGNYVFALDR